VIAHILKGINIIEQYDDAWSKMYNETKERV